MADALNAISRTASLRLGATEEGTLRQYSVRADGALHTAVCYRITAAEWPAVRARLQEMLARR
jgi:RimJ/RimL family protein N-acetyltransferase